VLALVLILGPTGLVGFFRRFGKTRA